MKKHATWIVAAVLLATGGFIAFQALANLSGLDDEALAACHEYLVRETGEDIDVNEVDISSVNTVFPDDYGKRFRATCTYGGIMVRMEALPSGPWYAVGSEGLQ